MMRAEYSYKAAACLLVMALFMPMASHAQEIPEPERAPSPRERIFFGGNFGLQLGTITYIEASPVIGYWLLPRIAVAGGPYYRYLKDPGGSTDIAGGKFFTRLYFIRELDNIIPLGFNMGLYLQGEYENLSLRSDWFLTQYDRSRFNVNVYMAGFGFSQYTGPRGSINFSVLWVVNTMEVEIYDSPEFRIGFTF